MALYGLEENLENSRFEGNPENMSLETVPVEDVYPPKLEKTEETETAGEMPPKLEFGKSNAEFYAERRFERAVMNGNKIAAKNRYNDLKEIREKESRK